MKYLGYLDIEVGVEDAVVCRALGAMRLTKFALEHTFAELEEMLREDLELHWGREQGRWDMILSTCGTVMEVSPNMSLEKFMLFGLMTLNAARRCEPDKAMAIESVITDIDGQLSAVRDAEQRLRLEELFAHHAGMWSSECGKYARAADYLRRSAEVAAQRGDVVNQSTALLRKAHELLCQAIVDGRPEFEALVEAVEEAAKTVVEVCAGNDSTQVAWRGFNAPAHVLLAHIWTGVPITEDQAMYWGSLFKELSQLAPKVHASCVLSIMAARAGIAIMLKFCDWERANAICEQIASSGTTDDKARMTAQLVHAQVLNQLRLQGGQPKLDTVRQAYEVIAAPGHRMHQLRAKAKRILEHELDF